MQYHPSADPACVNSIEVPSCCSSAHASPSHSWSVFLICGRSISARPLRLGETAAAGGDPAKLFVFGHSSGCHLAAILGANPKYLAAVGLSPSDLAGVVAMGCVLAPLEQATTRFTIDELRQRWPKSGEASTFATFDERLDSDPSRFIGPHMPPTLVVIAEAERFFPAILEQGAKFVRRLLEAKRPADVVIVPGSHMNSIGNIWQKDDPTRAALLKFIANPSAAGASSAPSPQRRTGAPRRTARRRAGDRGGGHLGQPSLPIGPAIHDR